jgi:hypothetical protein
VLGVTEELGVSEVLVVALVEQLVPKPIKHVQFRKYPAIANPIKTTATTTKIIGI